ncbi:acyl-coenzyme A oxidase-like protein isoform X7 [Macaca nemestrina]|uniref:acyl-coenzyme A oxidase-like protein isoform X7 n=1 Tax=Macaca nemestrina TaxID=9545 RepID=UPI0039B90C24
MGAPPPAFAGLGGREEEQRPPETAGEEEQRPPEAAGEEEQRPPEAAGEEEQRPPEAAGEEEQRPPEAAGEEEQRPPEAAGEEEQRPPEAAGEEDGCVLLWCFSPVGYDLSLDEMRALTVQRVRFAMGLPLLKCAVQDLEFVIDTPCENAEKMYIGNAMYRNYAAVFAQLIVDGRSQGPHCFIVLVRDENGSLYPGVTAIDRMYKEGLHGVDNGMVIFDKVRIPRENPLDKYAGALVDEDVFQGKELVSSHSLQALVAGLKAYSTWENIRCLQDYRECTGGMLPVSCLRAVSLVTSALEGQVESRINTLFHLTFKLEEELTTEFHQGYMMEN